VPTEISKKNGRRAPVLENLLKFCNVPKVLGIGPVKLLTSSSSRFKVDEINGAIGPLRALRESTKFSKTLFSPNKKSGKDPVRRLYPSKSSPAKGSKLIDRNETW